MGYEAPAPGRRNLIGQRPRTWFFPWKATRDSAPEDAPAGTQTPPTAQSNTGAYRFSDVTHRVREDLQSLSCTGHRPAARPRRVLDRVDVPLRVGHQPEHQTALVADAGDVVH